MTAAKSAPLLEARDLVTQFGGDKPFLAKRRPIVRAVDEVTMAVNEGEIFGLVGESGCGKSTLAKTLLGLQDANAGTIVLDGKIVSGIPAKQVRQARRDIQYMHQDPGASLDPWWSIGRTLHESLIINGVAEKGERDRRIKTMLEAVGLDLGFCRRYPHELSGGQQRRVALARILSLQPRIVILDEPTSGLDLSVQATVLRLIRDLRNQFGLTYILISHDLSVVEHMCDRIAVMYLGRIVELGAATDLFATPRHPYTKALLAASPRLEGDDLDAQRPLKGDPPSPSAKPSGCAFRNRCPHATKECADELPRLQPLPGLDQAAACLRLDAIDAEGPAGESART